MDMDAMQSGTLEALVIKILAALIDGDLSRAHTIAHDPDADRSTPPDEQDGLADSTDTTLPEIVIDRTFFLQKLLKYVAFEAFEQSRIRSGKAPVATVVHRIATACQILKCQGYRDIRITAFGPRHKIFLEAKSTLYDVLLVKHFRVELRNPVVEIGLIKHLEGPLTFHASQLPSHPFSVVLSYCPEQRRVGLVYDTVLLNALDLGFPLPQPSEDFSDESDFSADRLIRSNALHTSPAPPPAHPFRVGTFASLPLEIRNRIYDQVLGRPFYVVNGASLLGGKSELSSSALTVCLGGQSGPICRSLSQVNRLLNREIKQELAHLCLVSAPLVILPQGDAMLSLEIRDQITRFHHLRAATFLEHDMPFEDLGKCSPRGFANFLTDVSHTVVRVQRAVAQIPKTPLLQRLSVSVVIPLGQRLEKRLLPPGFWETALDFHGRLEVAIYMTQPYHVQGDYNTALESIETTSQNQAARDQTTTIQVDENISRPAPATYYLATTYPCVLWASSIYSTNDKYGLLSMLHGEKLDLLTRFELRKCGFMNLAEPRVGMSISCNERRVLERIVPMRGMRCQNLEFSDLFDDGVKRFCSDDHDGVAFAQNGQEEAAGMKKTEKL